MRRSAGSRLRLAAVPTRRSDRSIKGDSCLVALSWATAKALSTSTHYHQQQQQERPDVESAPTEGAAERVRWGQEEEATKAQGRNTHFGFKDVAEDDKAGMGEYAAVKIGTHYGQKKHRLITLLFCVCSRRRLLLSGVLIRHYE